MASSRYDGTTIASSNPRTRRRRQQRDELKSSTERVSKSSRYPKKKTRNPAQSTRYTADSDQDIVTTAPTSDRPTLGQLKKRLNKASKNLYSEISSAYDSAQKGDSEYSYSSLQKPVRRYLSNLSSWQNASEFDKSSLKSEELTDLSSAVSTVRRGLKSNADESTMYSYVSGLQSLLDSEFGGSVPRRKSGSSTTKSTGVSTNVKRKKRAASSSPATSRSGTSTKPSTTASPKPSTRVSTRASTRPRTRAGASETPTVRKTRRRKAKNKARRAD